MWDLIVSVPDHCLSFYFVGYEDSYKISDKFDFGQDRTIFFEVTCP